MQVAASGANSKLQVRPTWTTLVLSQNGLCKMLADNAYVLDETSDASPNEASFFDIRSHFKPESHFKPGHMLTSKCLTQNYASESSLTVMMLTSDEIKVSLMCFSSLKTVGF